MARAGTVYVSLQDPRAGETAVARHRTSGVLLAADLVTIPSLKTALIGEMSGYEVLLVSAGDDNGRGRRAERIGISWVEAHSSRPGEAVAMIRLARRSLLPVARPRSVGSDQLRDGLVRHEGDFWSVLWDRGLEPVNRDADPAAVLADLPPVVESVPGPPPVELVSYSAPGDAGVGICDLVPWCVGPPPPRPLPEAETSGCCGHVD